MIELGLIYPVDTDGRRMFRRVSGRILTEIAAGGIGAASQTVAIVQFPSNRPPEQLAFVGSRQEEEETS